MYFHAENNSKQIHHNSFIFKRILKNEKKILTLFFYSARRPDAAHGPSRAAERPRAQAATWAWAKKVARPRPLPGLLLAHIAGRALLAVGLNPMAARAFRPVKTGAVGGAQNPSSFFLSPPFLSRRAAGNHGDRTGGRGAGGAAAGPLTGARSTKWERAAVERPDGGA